MERPRLGRAESGRRRQGRRGLRELLELRRLRAVRARRVPRAQRTEARDPRRAMLLSPVELRPEPFQERLLEQIALRASRATTGTCSLGDRDRQDGDGGRRLRAPPRDAPRARSCLSRTARRSSRRAGDLPSRALRDHAFGELWVGGAETRDFEHVFASIQSLNASGVAAFDPDALRRRHRRRVPPRGRALLPRPARPRAARRASRSHGDAGAQRRPAVLGWFDDRIAAELRLWDAIDQHRLVPFAYFGIQDGLDLREVPWQRGRATTSEGLSNPLTATMRGRGWCSSSSPPTSTTRDA